MRKLLSKYVFPYETVSNWHIGLVVFGIALLFGEGSLLLGYYALETGIIGSVATGLLVDLFWLSMIVDFKEMK